MDDLYYLRKGGAYYGPDSKGYVCDGRMSKMGGL
jgi:hypothetical protein